MSVQATQNFLLKKLLLPSGGGSRLWTALAAQCIGTALLLIAVLLWWNFRELLAGRGSDDSLGSTFLTVSKKVTPEAMAQPGATMFPAPEIDALRRVAEVEDVGAVQAVKPEVYMSMEVTPGLGFSTIMILEAVPERFMDKRPGGWDWKSGSVQVPIILSSSFLSLYNYVFAPSQGLPQLSEETIGALPFKMSVGTGTDQKVFIARVVGFSDRITSVLVPETFVSYVNSGISTPPSRIIVKLKDPSAKPFNDYLSSHNYVTNSEQLRWSRLRAIVQAVASSTGILALILMGVSLFTFLLFIELTVSRAADNVRLLLQLGYGPGTLGRFMYRRFLPLLLGSQIVALVIAIGAQAAAAALGKSEGLQLGSVPGWPVWVVSATTAVLLLAGMRRGVVKALEAV